MQTNKSKCLDLLALAAEGGDAPAQSSLGDAHFSGFADPEHPDDPDAKIEKDEKQAAIWYKKAAKQGNTDAMVQLAGMYQAGNGVPKNRDKAIAYLKKAAKRGDADAQGYLASSTATRLKTVNCMEDQLMYGICRRYRRYEPARVQKLCECCSKTKGTSQRVASLNALLAAEGRVRL